MNSGKPRLAILGAGSWGTALAVALAPNFASVRLWFHNADLARAAVASRENAAYLPGITLPGIVSPESDPARAIHHADIILAAIPSPWLGAAIASLKDHIPPRSLIVSATKGLEPSGDVFVNSSGTPARRMTEVISDAAHISPDRVLALSGPSFAIEVARGLPTAVVAAGQKDAAKIVQSCFVGPAFRVYTSGDTVGVELGGALKNVVAIGAGLAAGLGLGFNASAALITRGLAEITRLAISMGAQPRTLSGLTGLGDLVLTCTGELSRNRRLGIALSVANSASEVLCRSSTTTEGVRAAAVAVELGHRFDVEMPVAEQVLDVLDSKRSPREAIALLMERSLKEE